MKYSLPSFIFRVKGETDRILKILTLLRMQRMYPESLHVFSTFSRESRFLLVFEKSKVELLIMDLIYYAQFSWLQKC